MHHNIDEQRNNWNTFLLNSINMITLTATTMSGVVAIAASSCSDSSLLVLKLPSKRKESKVNDMELLLHCSQS
ncbi:hypothetical protein P8452_46143 [Trifolium repens]|nr:hypothetical protein P8452_46143 [Trifolium repens]